MYGRPPPMLSTYEKGTTRNEEVERELIARDENVAKNTLIQEGKEMTSVLYTYRSCVKALPQFPSSIKQSQADMYLETYQVLDLEMSRLREI
ncbi:hypothetical protein LWI28_003237 [Acer negundo]|uniref:Uncharacterized protein n=1 Tax=Acer negundo TaxID=4023 RepID=A0AAD5NW83_ACENE|nr:hypothetical protein LWI28_003237 [Acer negundo]